MTLVSPNGVEPELSVVMVTYGAWPLTEQAVAALAANTQRPLELIVVDNHSDDETRARLSELENAQVIFNDENRGFGPATNQGAERARGTYLLLLNTDVFVHSGWLEPLLETLRTGATGAVVPRFLHPDGSLQDAGTLLAQDGTVHVYGDGDNPNRLCYRFGRIVDLGTAACMLIRLTTFAALEGFDTLFAPAYYEDTDLCMRLAERGLNVRYEPRSTVTHVRYGSGGVDDAAALSDRHRRLFVERWGPRLNGRPRSFRYAGEQAVIAARDALASPRVLVGAPSGHPAAEVVARMLLREFPSARVTWATGPCRDPSRWLAVGLEVVDDVDPSWLDDRLYHYDLVVLDGQSDTGLEARVKRTQPQAPRLALDDLDGPLETLRSRLTPILAGAGIAPPIAP